MKNLAKAAKKPALGRGLSALIPGGAASEARAGAVLKVPLDRLVANRLQPRETFDDEALAELALSIGEMGILEPILVSAPDAQGQYAILAGERRFRAARRAGLAEVPVLVHAVAGDRERLEVALVENIQRADLDAIEEALAYQKLRDKFGLTQDDIARRVGKDRASVANTLRLLRLPESIQGDLRARRLTFGHAKAILGLEKDEDRLHLAAEIVRRGWSVREAEEWVKARPEAGGKARREPQEKDVFTRDAEKRLSSALRTRVEIVRRGKGGDLRLRFGSEDELMRLFDLLSR